nr:hypothetical protein [Burkholderia pyrrocinia]
MTAGGVRETEVVGGRADVPVDEVCAGFAGWPAEAWERLDDEIALLTSVGATLWRGIRAAGEIKSPARAGHMDT